jgi:hypothetical protein
MIPLGCFELALNLKTASALGLLRTTPGVALGIAQIGSGSHLPRKGCTTSNVTMLSATQAPTIATTIAAAFSQRLIAMGTSHCRAGPPQLAASFIAARNGVTSPPAAGSHL